jgi:transcription elongation factor GreA-like protein
MKLNLYEGENVRHKAKAEWGIGKIMEVNSCGTIKVIFEGNKEVSIAQGSKFLIKVTQGKN